MVDRFSIELKGASSPPSADNWRDCLVVKCSRLCGEVEKTFKIRWLDLTSLNVCTYSHEELHLAKRKSTTDHSVTYWYFYFRSRLSFARLWNTTNLLGKRTIKKTAGETRRLFFDVKSSECYNSGNCAVGQNAQLEVGFSRLFLFPDTDLHLMGQFRSRGPPASLHCAVLIVVFRGSSSRNVVYGAIYVHCANTLGVIPNKSRVANVVIYR